MDMRHQAPDELVGTGTPLAHPNGVEAIKDLDEPEHLPVTIHYSTFRLSGSQVSTGGDDDQRLAAFRAAAQDKAKAKAKADYEEAEAAFEECKRFYHVEPDEWAAAEARWQEWVAKRGSGSAALESGRFHVSLNGRAPWRQKEVDGAVAEARFSEVLEPQHSDKCVSCEAKRIAEEDPALSDAEKSRRITRLAHEIPRLQLSSSAGALDPVKASSDLSEEILDELNTSTWGSQKVELVQKKHMPSIVDILIESLPKPDILGLKPGSWTELGDRREPLIATKQLLQSTDDAAMLDAMMLDPTLLLRARVFRQNKQAVEEAIDALNHSEGLSAADRETMARTTAEAWELKRDLLKLEGLQKTLGVRIECAKKGYSVNGYNSRVARMRRENYADVDSHPLRYGRLGFARGSFVDHEDEEEEEPGDEEKYVTAEESSNEMDKPLQLEEQRSLKISAQPEAAELDTEPKRSPSPLGLTNSSKQHMQTLPQGPTQSTCSPSMFLNTLTCFISERRVQASAAPYQVCT
ncbi:hypothetical protein ST47_g9466, partial [Ascochyta rabiei]